MPIPKPQMHTNIYIPFAKTDDEKRMVYGYCTSEAVDSHGEIVRKSAIRKAWDGYMEYANIREMHQPSAVGVTKEFQHDDNGTWIGVKVVDDRAWKFVKEGVYKGFSIGGRVLKKTRNIIEEIILAEISLVDRPANPDSKFSAVKIDGGLIDKFALQAETIRKQIAMKKYVEIEGVKFVEDPENPGNALVGEDGNQVLYVEESATEPEVTPEETKEETVEETPTPEAEPETPVETEVSAEGEKGEGAVDLKKNINKDTMGVITLAGALDHLAFIKSMFEMNGKDVGGIESIMETCKEMIAKEASEKEAGAGVGDLAKAVLMGIESKLLPVITTVETLKKSVETLTSEVNTMKSQKVSPRPKAAIAVDKAFVNKDGGSSSTSHEAKKKEIEAISLEINKNASAMKAAIGNPIVMDELKNKGEELFGKLMTAKRELKEMI